MKHSDDYIVDPETGCWMWQRGKHPDGYGMTREDGRSRLAHRVYYERLVGPIPFDLQIDHLCKNRACVNPAHMEVVTAIENAKRAAVTRMENRRAKLLHAYKGEVAS